MLLLEAKLEGPKAPATDWIEMVLAFRPQLATNYVDPSSSYWYSWRSPLPSRNA